MIFKGHRSPAIDYLPWGILKRVLYIQLLVEHQQMKHSIFEGEGHRADFGKQLLAFQSRLSKI